MYTLLEQVNLKYISEKNGEIKGNLSFQVLAIYYPKYNSINSQILGRQKLKWNYTLNNLATIILVVYIKGMAALLGLTNPTKKMPFY